MEGLDFVFDGMVCVIFVDNYVGCECGECWRKIGGGCDDCRFECNSECEELGEFWIVM